MRLTEERETFIRETGGGFGDIKILMAEVDALRTERDAAQMEHSDAVRELTAALARAEAAEAERDDLRARIEAVERVMYLADAGEFTDDEYDAGIPILSKAVRAALRGESVPACAMCNDTGRYRMERCPNPVHAESASPQPPNPEPAPCATCGDQREVCRLCGPMPRGATCLDHHHDEGIPCPSCAASSGR